MKNIAILFLGRIKSYEDCFESYKTFILNKLLENDNKVDTFLYHNSGNINDNVNDFCKIYNVVSFINEDIVKNPNACIPIIIDYRKCATPMSKYFHYLFKKRV